MRAWEGGSMMNSLRSQTTRESPAFGLGILVILLFLAMPLMIDHDGSVMAQAGKAIGPEPNVFTPHGQPIGSVDNEGKIYALHGNLVGKVDADGVVYNVSNTLIGKVGPDGKVVNQSGHVLCTVGSDGTVFNVSGTVIGLVKVAGGKVTLMGGAARLLLLRHK